MILQIQHGILAAFCHVGIVDIIHQARWNAKKTLRLEKKSKQMLHIAQNFKNQEFIVLDI